MEYTPGWIKTKERLSAFWEREIIDRCCISVEAPKSGSKYELQPLPDKYEDRVKYWTDGERILHRYENRFKNTYFKGDAFPLIWLDLGAAGHAGYFKNIKYQFENTVWFFPFIKDYDVDQIIFDEKSVLYRKTLELARYFTSESKGKYLVSMADTAGNLDALGHMRGSEELLIDMLYEKERVHGALNKIRNVWDRINTEIYDIIKENNEGGSSIGWLNTWAPGKHGQMQCDISVMISPDMFSEFVIDELNVQSEFYDYPLYHLDGMEQVRHLDNILAIEKLRAIQWTCVDGQPSPVKFIPELKRIQTAGKSLLIRIKSKDMEPLMEQLSSKGLHLVVEDASSKEEADYLVKRACELTHE